MVCHNCKIGAKKHGKDCKGSQRYKCHTCIKTFIEPQDKPLDAMRLPLGKAVVCLHLLCEGNSIRSVERLNGSISQSIFSTPFPLIIRLKTNLPAS